MIERRIHPRAAVSYPALYRSNRYAGPQVCSTIDLSTGGARLERPYSLRTGDGLEISIAIPLRVIRCRGRVVYVSSSRKGRLIAGVQFQNLLKRDTLYLKRYIAFVMKQRAREASRKYVFNGEIGRG